MAPKTHPPSVIISGASSGIGLAAAVWLAVYGTDLVLVARRAERLSRIASELEKLGVRAVTFAGDVTDPDTSHQAVLAARDHFGRLDGIINNAGTVRPLGRIADLSPSGWQRNLAVNLSGPFLLMRAALPFLRPSRGRIVNVSSGAAQHAIAGAAVYCAAKAGLNQLTRVLAEEEPDLMVVAVRPGVVDTEMQAVLRLEGPERMPRPHAQYYQDLKDQGSLLHASVPARTIAWLVRHGPGRLSGRFVNHDDPDFESQARAVFQKEAQVREICEALERLPG